MKNEKKRVPVKEPYEKRKKASRKGAFKLTVDCHGTKKYLTDLVLKGQR